MSYTLRDTVRAYSGNRVHVDLLKLERDIDSRPSQREVVVHPGAVVVLPLLDARSVLLVRNQRWAVGKRLLELPAGTLQKGEPPINCAGRELQEETGYLAGRLRPIGQFYASPGILSEKLYAFAAYDLTRTVQHLDEGEELEVVQSTIDDALDLIRRGEIEDAKSIATLLMHEALGMGR